MSHAALKYETYQEHLSPEAHSRYNDARLALSGLFREYVDDQPIINGRRHLAVSIGTSTTHSLVQTIREGETVDYSLYVTGTDQALFDTRHMSEREQQISLVSPAERPELVNNHMKAIEVFRALAAQCKPVETEATD